MYDAAYSSVCYEYFGFTSTLVHGQEALNEFLLRQRTERYDEASDNPDLLTQRREFSRLVAYWSAVLIRQVAPSTVDNFASNSSYWYCLY
jgi:predicted lipoprotein